MDFDGPSKEDLLYFLTIGIRQTAIDRANGCTLLFFMEPYALTAKVGVYDEG
jgi:hypothetical protein